MRNLVLILGDQLSRESKALDGFDKAVDAVGMAEVQEEATHVWSHKLRLTLFLSAMRHFRDRLRHERITVHYHQMTEQRRDERGESFAAVLRQDVARLRPRRLILIRPGDYRVLRSLEKAAGLPLELRQDSHFYSTVDEFLASAEGKKRLLLEGFYRFMRKKHRILLSPDGKPFGERWNFDKENRSAFGSRRPALDYRPASFPPDETTREVIQLVAA